MPCAPFPRGSAFPSLKGSKERIGMLVAQQESGFVQFDGAMLEVVVRQFAPGVFDQLLEGDVGIGEAALQGARAHAELPGDLPERGTFAREGALNGMLDLIANLRIGAAFLKLRFQLSTNDLEQLLVLRDKRPIEVAA